MHSIVSLVEEHSLSTLCFQLQVEGQNDHNFVFHETLEDSDCLGVEQVVEGGHCVFKSHWRQCFTRPFRRQVLLTTEFNRPLCDLETSADITTVERDFSRNEFKTFLVHNVLDVHKAFFQNDLNLL